MLWPLPVKIYDSKGFSPLCGRCAEETFFLDTPSFFALLTNYISPSNCYMCLSFVMFLFFVHYITLASREYLSLILTSAKYLPDADIYR
jgi:hypothetical protein